MLKSRRIVSLFVALFSGIGTWAQLTPTYDDIWVPMSDGDSLQADVYLPDGASAFEVILIQTPYNKNTYVWSLPMGVGQNLNAQPFAFVIVDWRGFYGSSNADVSNVDRGQDAYDVCDWIVAQPWHLNRIGTWGPSALGGVQYNLMREQHPNHTCAVPLVAVGQTSYDHYFYGGVLEEARLEQLDALGYGLSPTIMANTYYNSTWQYVELTSYAVPDIIIPTLQIGGWYDHNIDDMMDFYEATRTQTIISIQDEQWLLVGPWVHGGTGAAYVGSAIQGELSYPDAQFKSDSMARDFFEYYLLDSANNWQNTPKITYYEMGGNDTWHTTNDYNIEGDNDQVLYLNSQWRLTPAIGNGTSTFTVDPNDPSPTIGGATLHDDLDQGPYDQTYLDGRTDIYTFASDTLTEAFSVTGRIWLDLFVSADQPDCDISIRLVDVYPDGTNMLITDGIKRMRFREGYTLAAEQLMTPGEIYNVQIKLPFTNYTWLPGHQIKIYVGGNHSTRFNVNLQNGGPMYTAGIANIANISLHHDELYPAKVVFPSDNDWLTAAEEINDGFLVYPNPANTELHVVADQEFLHYAIFDISGRQVSGDVLTGHSIDVSELTEGVYILKLTDEDGNVAEEKFLKN